MRLTLENTIGQNMQKGSVKAPGAADKCFSLIPNIKVHNAAKYL
jgi:hypothetical protein